MNLNAAEFTELLKQYWYIAVAALIVAGIIIAAFTVCMKKLIKQAKENSAVNKARKEQLEISKMKAQRASLATRAISETEVEEEPEETEIAETKPESGEPTENTESSENMQAKEAQTDTEENNTVITADNKENIPMEKKTKAETKNVKAQAEEEAEVVVEVQEAAEPGKPAAKALYRVIYDKENKEWMVKKDGAARVIRRVKTKAEALELANQFATNQDLSLVVQKKDGKFQKKSNYNKMITPAKGEKKK